MTKRVDLKIVGELYNRIEKAASSRSLAIPAFIKWVVTEWLIKEGF